MAFTRREVELLKDAISFFAEHQSFPANELGKIYQELDAVDTKLTIYNQGTFE